MATGKRPDPRKRKTAHPHATNFKVPCGTKAHGYMAGEIYGCYVHRTHASQPCLESITDNELECPYCRAGVEAVFRGYVPIWDVDFALRYAIIGEGIFDSVDLIGFHEQVILSRHKNPISPLIIRQEQCLTRSLPQKAPYSSAVSMLCVCLTFWKNEALTRWCMANQPLALGSSPPRKEQPKAIVTPYVAPPEPVSDSLDGAMARLAVSKNRLPSTNGKPAPKG